MDAERKAGVKGIGSAVVDVTPGDYFELIVRQTLWSDQERRRRRAYLVRPRGDGLTIVRAFSVARSSDLPELKRTADAVPKALGRHRIGICFGCTLWKASHGAIVALRSDCSASAFLVNVGQEGGGSLDFPQAR